MFNVVAMKNDMKEIKFVSGRFSMDGSDVVATYNNGKFDIIDQNCKWVRELSNSFGQDMSKSFKF